MITSIEHIAPRVEPIRGAALSESPPLKEGRRVYVQPIIHTLSYKTINSLIYRFACYILICPSLYDVCCYA